MAEEIERKYLGVTRAVLREKLVALGASPLGGAHFESNHVWDRPGHDLHLSGRLLRLRLREWQKECDVRLTYKERLPDGIVGGRPVKRRKEIELGVGDAEALAGILRGLGYVPVMSYEKVRESWLCEGVHVDMDELPFGDVVELEGTPEGIARAEQALGLSDVPVSADNYEHLHNCWRKERGLAPQVSFYFDDERRARVRLDLGLGAGGGLQPLKI